MAVVGLFALAACTRLGFAPGGERDGAAADARAGQDGKAPADRSRTRDVRAFDGSAWLDGAAVRDGSARDDSGSRDASVDAVAPANVTAASCALADVRAAVGAAGEGHIVQVPAGECSWNASLRLGDKSLTLRGAGSSTGGTTITYQGKAHKLIEIEALDGSLRIDVSGFRLVGGDADEWNGTHLTLSGPAGWKTVRVHHMAFEGAVNWAIGAFAGIQGTIDHCTFSGREHGISLYGQGDADWNAPLVLGTNDFLFVEDNTFACDDFNGLGGPSSLYLRNGGRVVFRHNTVRYGAMEMADATRTGQPGANAYEIYNNVFWSDTTKWTAITLDAGTGTVWGNTVSATYSFAIAGTNYKSADPRALPLCDGSDPADQNTPGLAGWRCRYQLGSHGLGASAVGFPLYLWSNMHGASATGLVVRVGADYVLSGRDYVEGGSTPKPGYTPHPYPRPLP